MYENNGYLFRIFKKDPDGRLYSPYVQSKARYTTNDSILKDRVNHKAQEKTKQLQGLSYYDSYVSENKNIDRSDILHRGLSTIGLSDPKYSLYSIADIHERFPLFSIKKDGTVWYDSDTAQQLPKDADWFDNSAAYPNSITQLLKEAFNNEKNEVDEKGRLNLGKLSEAQKDDINEGYANIDNMLYNYAHGVSVNNWRRYYEKRYKLKQTPKTFDKWSLDNIDNLMQAIYETFDNVQSDDSNNAKSHIYLVQAPLDKIYTTNDVEKGKTIGYRDFPEEMLVKELRPTRDITDRFNYEKFNNTIDKWNDKSDKRKAAADYLSDMIKDDPNSIVSDEDKKYIWNDILDSYTPLLKQRNIVNGIMEMGQ